MPIRYTRSSGPLPALLALLAGALAPLSFSPLGLWPAGILSVMGLLVLLQHYGRRRAASVGWFYGVGFFGLGVSWVYVSIHVYGNAGPLLAGVLTLALIMGLALFFSLQCWLFQRYFSHHYPVLGFAALWVLFEGLRGWILTGFPWLYLGYAHLDTWLAGLAPVFGVLGGSFAVVLSAGLLVQLYRHFQQSQVPYALPLGVLSLLALWGIPAVLLQVNWVQVRAGESIQVGLVQANIEQNRKFDRDFLQQSLRRYETLSNPLWDNDVVLWPETAIPLLYQQAGPVLDHFSNKAVQHDSVLVSGILYRQDGAIHNSIISLGNDPEDGVYHKQKLVPFGEYVPLEGLLSGLLEIFSLPMSSLRPGPADQDLLQAAGAHFAAYICYEVVYPDFVRRSAREADFLVTISNDTWFGASWGPLQHLQMAAMRALENGRYMVRATNNGVSAIIDEKGRILQRSQQFQAAVLEGEVQLFNGSTPFSRWGSWPVLLLSGVILLTTGLITRQTR